MNVAGTLHEHGVLAYGEGHEIPVGVGIGVVTVVLGVALGYWVKERTKSAIEARHPADTFDLGVLGVDSRERSEGAGS